MSSSLSSLSCARPNSVPGVTQRSLHSSRTLRGLGRLHRPSPVVRAVPEITEDIFKQEVLEAPCPVLVDFWADWCGPCKLMAPLMDKLQAEYGDTLKVVKVDCDNNANLVEEYGVYGLPSLMLFKDGKPIEGSKREGAVPLKGIKDWMESNGIAIPSA